MKTRDAVQDVVAIARSAHRNDPEGFALLLPDNLPDALRMLTTACSLIDALTAGPTQDQVMDQMVSLAEGFGEQEMKP